MDLFDTYCDLERRINEGLIRVDKTRAPKQGYGPNPERRLDAMRDLLDRIDHPERGLRAIHIAGTSGKGSVAAATAGILSAAGLRVGLHISPYLQSMTEKIQIDGVLLDVENLAAAALRVLPHAERLLSDDAPASVHGMASVAIALEGFRNARPDVVVVEAGCGARFDLTSVVETEVAVLTNVGADHLDVLGPTVADVAWHKASVARPGKPLVTGASGAALEIVRAEASSVGARLIEIPRGATARAHNEALAEAAARAFLESRGESLSRETLFAGLRHRRLPCRAETVQERPRVILDGAHNPEKIAVAVDETVAIAPGLPRVAVVGLLAAKASWDLVRPLAGRFDAVVATEPRALGKPALPSHKTAELLRAAGLDAECEPDPDRAVDRAIALATENGSVVVLGSFYLVGALRNRWYRKREVVLQRTSWPTEAVEEDGRGGLS